MVDLKLPKKRSMLTKAPSWKRIFSFIIDLFIINIFIIGPFTAVLQNSMPTSTDFMDNYNFLYSNPELIDQLSFVFGVIFILIFAYFVLFEYKLRQTPGKMFFNLYLAPMKKKEQLTVLRIILRNVAVFPIFPFSLLWIIDPLYLIFTGKRLSDVFSKTVYVEEISL